MLFMIIFLQVIIAGVVFFVLRTLLERELLLAAIDRILALDPGENAATNEVTILVAHNIPSQVGFRLRTAIKEKFPLAEINVMAKGEIWGGVVVQAGKLLLDFSVVNRIKHIVGQKES